MGAVELLTREEDADPAAYRAHVARIAEAPGRIGELARIVKRADLHDRLRHQGVRTSTAVARPACRSALRLLSAAEADRSAGNPKVAL